MNERLEQLKRRAVAEADTSHIDFDNMSHSEIQMLGDIAVEKKFAELIVQECVEVCGGIAAVRAGYNDVDGRDTAYSCGDIIKEHFGIE